MANEVTLTDLRNQSRQRADMVNSTFITDAELDGYINEGFLELYDLLTQKFGDEYFHTSFEITIGPTANVYALPSDFYKLKGVEIDQAGGGNRFTTVVPFMFQERNRYAFNSTQLPSRIVRIRYVPTATRLTDTAQTFATTDVSTANDTITEADHGLSTSRPITFTTTGTLPAGLTLNTTFFVIFVDVNTFKVASNLQNAFDETPVDITDVGTGTHTIVANKDRFDFIDGYESYVIWRAVEMMKEKEESDTQVATGNVLRATERIESAAGNRDAALPQRIIDLDDINDIELRIFQETNIRYRMLGRNIEFIYIGYLGV